MEAANAGITWANFKNEILDNHFPANVRNRKEIEFLELKQGNMTADDNVAKFEELTRFCPYYNGVDAEDSGCVKFESDLRPEIKLLIEYYEIHCFSVLVNKCIIYDEDGRARSAHYKSVSEKKNGDQNHGVSYMTSVANGESYVPA